MKKNKKNQKKQKTKSKPNSNENCYEFSQIRLFETDTLTQNLQTLHCVNGLVERIECYLLLVKIRKT